MSWGWAIVALTVVVRAALLPLTLKQFKSMQNMVKFQPEIKRLQERYKGDRERLNQEMMKFYRENKVNPFASCLPLVAQLPVFLALFYMLQDDLRLDICPEVNPPGTEDPQPCGPGGAAEFLFIPDLTDKATGGVLVTLIILYVGSQLLSTVLMSTATDRTQRIIFLALPFVFVIFIINFPAGLLVYWITTNFWTIVQQTIVRKRLGPMRPPSPTAKPDRCRSWTACSTAEVAAPAAKRTASAGAGARAGQGGEWLNFGFSSRSDAEAAAIIASSSFAPQEEEAIREAPMSARDDTTPAERVRELLEHVNDALHLDANVEVVEERNASAGSSTATTWACSSGATARRSTPSSTSRSRWRRTGSRRPRRSRSTPRGTASDGVSRSSARQTRRRATLFAPPGRWRWTL